MQKDIRIAVIGGTGKSGKFLVQRLLSQGFSFKMLVRNADGDQVSALLAEIKMPLARVKRSRDQVASPLVEVVQGDARDYRAVHSLIKGCQAVISTLGQPKGEASIFSDATTNVIRSMNEWGIKRYILTTGLNVDTAFDKKGERTAMATEWMKANYPLTTADKQKELEVLMQGDIDWTLVRLPLIELTDERCEVKVSLDDCQGEKINAGALAEFLVGQLGEEGYVGKAPFIANG